MNQIGNNIQWAAQLLQEDQVVGMPTETVYGLAGNALSEKAIDRIYTVKNRPRTNPLIVHIHHPDQIELYAQNIPVAARQLAKAFWPGPLTLLLEKTNLIPNVTTSGSSWVALRMPNHPVALNLLKALDFPLAAPSANPYGYISPTKSIHVQKQLGTQVPYILEGGLCQKGIESTIVGFEAEKPIIFRSGLITQAQIEEVTGISISEVQKHKTVATPGSSKSHYAPRTPLHLGFQVSDLASNMPLTQVGFLAFSQFHPEIPIKNQRLLSPKASLDEAAQHLYEALHELDAQGLDLILAETIPDEALGKAINDRLFRAAHKIKKH